MNLFKVFNFVNINSKLAFANTINSHDLRPNLNVIIEVPNDKINY